MTQDILRPYSKASDQACVNAYMATLLGPGTFRLSRAISRCGWLVGFGALLCCSLMHIFICLRLVEVPQLIQQDVPNAAFLAKVFLHRRVYRIVAILSVLSWFGGCAIQLQNVISNVITVVASDIAEYADIHKFRNTVPLGLKIIVTLMLAVAIVPVSLKTSAKDLQTKASYAVYSMFAICAVEMSCAFIHGMFALSDAPPDYHSVGPNIPGGLFDMVLAFGGIAILPYVLADMLQPENSRKVVIKATTQIMFFYLSVAMICYFGWADSIQHETPLRLMMSMSTGYQYAARIISFLFIIKTVTTFPLTFWPLYREVEALLDLHEVPGLQLQLPWAIRRQRFLKVFIKITLVTACLMTLLLDGQSSHRMVMVFLGLPLSIGHFVFPACVGCLAIRMHQTILKTPRRQGENRNSLELGGSRVEYICSSMKIHYWAVHAAAAFMIIVGFGVAIYMVLHFSGAPDPQDALEDAAILNELDLEKRAHSLMSNQVRSAHSTVSGWGGDHYLLNQARSRLDARLWLMCRLALARGLAEEDGGMGKLGGSTRSVTSAIGSCLHHCQQGLDEAEAFGDIELMAEFSLLSVVQNLQQGKMATDLLETLENIISRLEQNPALSYSGRLLFVLSIIQHADIRSPSHESSMLPYLNDSLSAYKRAMTYLLDQLTQLGSDVNLLEMSPVSPLHNIYFQQLQPLIDLKLRLGRALTKQITLSERDSNVIPTEWQAAVRELELGLGLARTAAFQRKPVQAQLLFSLGQIQRQMIPSGQVSPSKVVNTLVEAVQCTFISDHDLGLMKQAYLEMALVLISNASTLKPPKTPDQPPRTAETTPSTVREGRKISKKGSAKEKERKEKETREKNKELDMELRTAWAAIRAAGVVSSAQYKIGIFTGDPEITALKLSEKAASSVPGLALFDLLGTDDVIKNSEDGALVAQDGIVTMGTTINNSNRVQVTWLHFLGYLSVLRRQCSYAALGVFSEDEEISNKGSATVLPLFSAKKALKLSKMHSFLKSELGPYAAECCGVFPPEVLSYYRPSSLPLTKVTEPSQTGVAGDSSKKADFIDKSTKAGDFEMCIQWFQPELDCVSVGDPEDTQSQPSRAVWFLYAFNSKALDLTVNPLSGQVKAGLCHVIESRAQALHEKLMVTLETAENDLALPVQSPQTAVGTTDQSRGRISRVEPVQLSVPGNMEQKSSSSGAPTRKKKSIGIRALSAKQRKDDHIKALLKEHLSEIRALLRREVPVGVEVVPFELSLYNVTCLEAMFDPSRGNIGKTTEAFYAWLSSLVEN